MNKDINSQENKDANSQEDNQRIIKLRYSITRTGVFHLFLWFALLGFSLLMTHFFAPTDSQIFSTLKRKPLYRDITPILTVDSLITGSTITLIALINFAPTSSGSSSIIKKVYWEIPFLTKKARRHEKCIWYFTSAFLVPHVVILMSITSTMILIVMVLTISSWNAILIVIIAWLLLTTFWLLLGALFRYVLFHRYTIRNTSKYLLHNFYSLFNKEPSGSFPHKILLLIKKIKNKFSKKPEEEYDLTKIKRFVNIINFLRATQNFELVQNVLQKIVRHNRWKNVNFNNLGDKYIKIMEENKVSKEKGYKNNIHIDELIQISYNDFKPEKAFLLLLWNIRGFQFKEKKCESCNKKTLSWKGRWIGEVMSKAITVENKEALAKWMVLTNTFYIAKKDVNKIPADLVEELQKPQTPK